MPSRLLRAFTVLGLLGMVAPAIAQASEAQIDEIIVTATRSARLAADIPRSVSVVTNEEVERFQAPTVLNILRDLPGVSSATDGGLGGQVVIRGFSTQGFRAPLYVDGDRFRGRNTLEYNLFNPNQIERIEVVRGPASSLYGTDAFGGVINIITKRSTGDVDGPFQLSDTALWLNYGSVNDMYGGRLQVGGAGNGFDFLLGGNFRRANDYDTPSGKINNSAYKAPSGDLSIGYTFSPGHRVEFVGRYSDIYRERGGGQFGAPGSTNAPGQLQREQTDRSLVEEFYSFRYTGESLFGGALKNTEFTVYRRFLDTHVHVIPNTNNPSVFVDSFVTGPTVWGGHATTTSDITDNLSITYGGDWYLESRPGGKQSARGGPVNQTSPESEQFSIGGFALANWQATPDLLLEGSIRIDRVRTSLDTSFITDPQTRDLFVQAGDTVNTPFTGSIGALFNVTDEVRLFGNIGTAFRAPSVTEITAVGAGVNPVFRLPNAGVKPEKAINYEAGVRILYPTWSFEAAGFVNELEDLINRDAPTAYQSAPAVQIQNIGEARVWGVELQGQWAITPDWLVRANATYTKGTDLTTNTPLYQIMPWNGVVGLRWQPQDRPWFIETTLDWAVDKDRINPALERPTAGYAVLNLYTSLDLQALSPKIPKSTLRFNIENLLDARYRLPTTPENIAFPVSPSNALLQPGRNFLLTLEFRY
ncbi:MAG: TonB-dependent receptor [Thiobacillus sp.]|nr:TonB-dependent receptor [Thiobacillus sp.]